MGHLVAWLNIREECGLMYSAGTSAECLGFFSPLGTGTVQGDPWLLVCFRRAFTIHKPSLPNQFSVFLFEMF